jgi:hypothetical protein
MAGPNRQMRIQSIRISERMWRNIQRQAAEQGISASQYIREATISRLAYDIAMSNPDESERWQRINEEIRRLTTGYAADDDDPD